MRQQVKKSDLCFSLGLSVHTLRIARIVCFIRRCLPAIEHIVRTQKKKVALPLPLSPPRHLPPIAIYRKGQFTIAFASVHIRVCGSQDDPLRLVSRTTCCTRFASRISASREFSPTTLSSSHSLTRACRAVRRSQISSLAWNSVEGLGVGKRYTTLIFRRHCRCTVKFPINLKLRVVPRQGSFVLRRIKICLPYRVRELSRKALENRAQIPPESKASDDSHR